ncbi:MAG: beta-galactosidase [Polyangiaceae bacterium]
MRISSTRGVKLVSSGLEIDGELVPLHAASVHYFRHDPAEWRACLSAIKDLGVRLVDVYVPWDVHEVSPGDFDFGERDPRRDVAAFLRLAGELGLFAIVRPGPHINAEMTCFGIPERVIWDPVCQARSPRQNPVFLPMLPLGFPVPSYASDAFFDEVARYFHALGPVLAPLLHPTGPVVMLQVDNEGAFYFRDGLYDQDYHADAVQHYRAHLRDRYKTIQALPAAYHTRLTRPADDPSADRAHPASKTTSAPPAASPAAASPAAGSPAAGTPRAASSPAAAPAAGSSPAAAPPPGAAPPPATPPPAPPPPGQAPPRPR